MKLRLFALALVVATSLFLFSLTTPTLAAVPDGGVTGGAAAARGNGQPTVLFGESGIFQKITNIMLFLIGAVSVIMIIIGGMRYILSGGDSANVSAAKNTILYAVVGIIVALLAYSIVNFVIGSFVDGNGSVTTGGSGGGSATSF